MANFIFNSARRLFASGAIDWTTSGPRPAGSAFTDYKIMAALVNKSGGTGIQNYSPPADPANDSVTYVANTSRNMLSDFGYGNTPANSSLIRNGTDAVITAELINRGFVAATGACDADDITFLDVPINPLTGTFGEIEGLIIYLKNESSGASTDGSDWPVLLFCDTITTGVLNLTPNGGDIVCQWSANGIFRL